jgi:quercetin dioxygenase-like cupin family protein
MSVFDKAIFSAGSIGTEKTPRGDDITVIARATQTNGMIGVWSSVIAPGTGPDWHSHSREVEVFHVVSGRFRFWCGSDVVDGGPGATIVLPPNVPHQWKNIGDTPGTMFSVVTPGGFEQLFIDMAALGANVTDEAMAAIDARLGVTEGPPV